MPACSWTGRVGLLERYAYTLLHDIVCDTGKNDNALIICTLIKFAIIECIMCNMYMNGCIFSVILLSGKYKEKAELCLDCRSQAAGHVLQQCCLNGHEATIVVYSDAEMREVVPVHWPALAFKRNVRWFSVKADHLKKCHDHMKCSYPHHYLEGRILNLWRENAVVTDTRPSFVRILTASAQ